MSSDLDDILFDSPESEEKVVEDTPGETPKVVTASSEKIVPGDEANQLAGRLEWWNKSCRDLFLDLRAVKFEATDEDMMIEFKDKAFYDKPIYFKMDPEDKKSDKITLARKQFCKLLGIPYSFFMNNRPALKKEIFNTW